jgi:MoxR-like ATPase
MKFDAKHFDPLEAGGSKIDADTVSFSAGELPEDVYVYKSKTILAVNLALATKRPLLISGEPGSGKSTVAQNLATALRWWYYKQMITSRLLASDLLWTFDALRRLSDANTPGQPLLPKQYYVDPGTLWWALDPSSAENRGSREPLTPQHRALNPGIPPAEWGAPNAVVLIDEIDKADPDVPNDLLETFDLQAFTVRETNDRVTAKRDLLLIITTNGERELPPAVLRRCITLTLDPPTEEWFKKIADQKYGASPNGLHADVAKEVMQLRNAARQAGLRGPSVAEYLDALKAARDLSIDTKSKAWNDVARSVLWKHEQDPAVEEPKEAAEEHQ